MDRFGREVWHVVVVNHLGLDRLLSKRLLNAIEALRTPETAALLYGVSRPLRAKDEHASRANSALFNVYLSPGKVIPLTELCVERGLLSRQEANNIQDVWLERTNSKGEWKEKWY